MHKLQNIYNIYNININRHNLIKYLNTPSRNVKSLSIVTDKLYIYGVKYTNVKYGEVVILAASANCKNDPDMFTLFWGNTQCKRAIDAYKDIWGFTEPNIIIAPTNKPLAILEVKGTYYNKSRNKCVNVECIPLITEATSNIDDKIEHRQEQLEQQVQQIEKERIKALENGPKLIKKMD